MKNTTLVLLCLLAVLPATAATLFPSRTDFRDEQIYFVITTRFYDGDPTNNTQCWDNQSKNAGDPAWRGDFKGLIEKLDYIKALGFTAIWITPVVQNASGYDYHGYHAMDFSQVDHRYESEDVQFQTLIDEVHKRGMKIILDIVLNHTGNFGEANLCKLFERDNSADQSALDECMIPQTVSKGGLLPDNYADLDGGRQYAARLSKMKNSSDENGQKKNYDSHNYWHHYGNFNWDEPNRWFAQIAGDCVDLNTENPAVYNYLIQCYSTFIRMGVDGFRIDTGGHIPRLTFNKAFVPAFAAAGAEAADKRGGTPFYMFAEVCARYSDILYRGQSCLSPFYYTWAENRDYAWDSGASSWDNLVEMEGSVCTSHANWASCWQVRVACDRFYRTLELHHRRRSVAYSQTVERQVLQRCQLERCVCRFARLCAGSCSAGETLQRIARHMGGEPESDVHPPRNTVRILWLGSGVSEREAD